MAFLGVLSFHRCGHVTRFSQLIGRTLHCRSLHCNQNRTPARTRSVALRRVPIPGLRSRNRTHSCASCFAGEWSSPFWPDGAGHLWERLSWSFVADVASSTAAAGIASRAASAVCGTLFAWSPTLLGDSGLSRIGGEAPAAALEQRKR